MDSTLAFKPRSRYWRAPHYGPPPPFYSPNPQAPLPQPQQAPQEDPEWKWMTSPEAKKLAAAARAKAISDFKKRFPNADMSKFKTEVSFEGHKAEADVLFIEGPDSWADVDINRPQEMDSAHEGRSWFGSCWRLPISVVVESKHTKANPSCKL